MFTRENLREIKSKAGEMAETDGMNKYWKQAYFDLAQAANVLDAMLARSVNHDSIDPKQSIEFERP